MLNNEKKTCPHTLWGYTLLESTCIPYLNIYFHLNKCPRCTESSCLTLKSFLTLYQEAGHRHWLEASLGLLIPSGIISTPGRLLVPGSKGEQR